MRRLSTRGFTLIEVVVATALMVAIIAGVAHGVLLSAGQSDSNRRDLRLLVRAQSKLERLRAAPEAAASGDDLADGEVLRWVVEPVEAGDSSTLLMRVCVSTPPTCVASIAVRP